MRSSLGFFLLFSSVLLWLPITGLSIVKLSWLLFWYCFCTCFICMLLFLAVLLKSSSVWHVLKCEFNVAASGLFVFFLLFLLSVMTTTTCVANYYPTFIWQRRTSICLYASAVACNNSLMPLEFHWLTNVINADCI